MKRPGNLGLWPVDKITPAFHRVAASQAWPGVGIHKARLWPGSMSLDGELFLEPGEFDRFDENATADLNHTQRPRLDLVFQVADAYAEFSGRLSFGEEFSDV